MPQDSRDLSDASASDRREHERVRKIYSGQYSEPYYQRIWGKNAAAAFMVERKWGLIGRALGKAGFVAARARILDLGAGEGGDCARFVEIGCARERILALDLVESYARSARRARPWLNCLLGDATRLPFPGASLDLVYQSTMLSSVLDPARRSSILGEAARVLKPGGWFMSYDTRYPNPWNPHTRPLRPVEFRSAFPGWKLSQWSLTGIPQLLRLVAPWSLRACHAIETIPILRSHLLVLARKPESSRRTA